jgi:hypothetical protein
LVPGGTVGCVVVSCVVVVEIVVESLGVIVVVPVVV